MKFLELLEEVDIKLSDCSDKAISIIKEMIIEMESYEHDLEIKLIESETGKLFFFNGHEYYITVSFQNTLTLYKPSPYDYGIDADDYYIDVQSASKELDSSQLETFGIKSSIIDIDAIECSDFAGCLVRRLLKRIFGKIVTQADIKQGWHERIFEFEGTKFGVWIHNKLLTVAVSASDNEELDDRRAHLRLTPYQMIHFYTS